MRKSITLGVLALAIIAASGVFLYERYIGFARAPLEVQMPSDAYAIVSVTHLRKAILAFYRDEQLRGMAGVAQAVAKSLSDALPGQPLTRFAERADPELLLRLGSHFRGQLIVGLLPNSDEQYLIPDLILATHFFGDVHSFQRSLKEALANQLDPARDHEWREEEWDGHRLHSLPLHDSRVTSEGIAIPRIEASWAITDNVLYAASNRAALKGALLRHGALAPESSLAHSRAISELPKRMDGADIKAFLNPASSLNLAAALAKPRMQQSSSLLRSVSLPRLIDALGFNATESLTFASQLSGKKTLYIGARYSERKGLWKALRPLSGDSSDLSPALSIQATETIGIDAGEAVLILKDALLKAAPVAYFPYLALRAKLASDSGVDLEKALQASFGDELVALQSLDIGTVRAPDGSIAESVVSDGAWRFALTDNESLERIWESQLPTLRRFFPDTFYSEKDQESRAFYLDSDRDSRITGNRFGLRFTENYLYLGYGTLKSFVQLGQLQKSPRPLLSDATSEEQVGAGYLRLQNLPFELPEIARVFYLQQNPWQPIPREFHEFDWSALSSMELERDAVSLDDGEGHLFRISQQR